LETAFSFGATPRIYNEDLGQLRGELKKSFEAAVEDVGEEKTVCHTVVCEVY
jgi:hypothetical protein